MKIYKLYHLDETNYSKGQMKSKSIHWRIFYQKTVLVRHVFLFVSPSVRQSTRNNSAPIGEIFFEYYIWDIFFLKSLRKFKFC